MMKDLQQAVIQWLQEAVIGLRLCPFAEPVLRSDKIKFVWENHKEFEVISRRVIDEIGYLDQKLGKETTSLVMLPELASFDAFLQVYYQIESLIEASPYRGRFQVASFHPDYVFADAKPDAIENYTNRSPVPMIHIINEADISRAVDVYKDIQSIPENNKIKLRNMGRTQVQALFRQWLTPKEY